MASNAPVVQKVPNGNQKFPAPLFLHGDLEMWILEAKSLPNMDLASDNMRKVFTMCGSCPTPICNGPKTLSGRHTSNTSDPYVSVCIGGATIAQTRVISNCENPLWEEHFYVPVAHPAHKLEFIVKDNDVLGADLIGVVEIPVQKILVGEIINDWFPVMGYFGNCLKPYPELHVTVQFTPVLRNPLYTLGIRDTLEYNGVSDAYFPQRKGGSLTLYQDAHVPNGMLPDIELDNGKVFRQGQCWEEICHAILEAQNLIYIIGWSVYHKVKLVREPTKPLPSGGELSLGDLLKYKSQEGVRVLMLIWDDKTSHDKFLFKTEGVMRTHDEETKKFFKNSNVYCTLSPRYPSDKLSIVKQKIVGTLFTHHQKCILVDTQGFESKRKITAFIGGLDLCDGRYDTPQHRLFQNLETIFQDDFHNPTFTSSCSSPRQPWHDLHCKIEGPAAYDILTNFEQRWRKATKWRDFKLKRVSRKRDDPLLKLERISWILTPYPGPDGDKPVRVIEETDPENWNVQVFRSIDSGSVKGFPKGVDEAKTQHLLCGKNLKVDKSIHSAYVNAIRTAQHFIYIENQYFLGSSYHWPSYKSAGADNMVPIELALKIANKIYANERFAAYVVIPMWPEGVPNSAAVQEILYWQGQTMAMMYKIVAEALETVGLSDAYHPQDYLNFYCLGKRESPYMDSLPKLNQATENRSLAAVQKYRRFMIYVHSKGMIVDDEYIIMGSANINQRSLDGSRDTEIAMGAYQPEYTWGKNNSLPHGQVYGYRMSLWAEHLGGIHDCFDEPQSLECVNHINNIARSNWEAYVSEEEKQLTGYLLPYPLQVSNDGKISALPDCDTFPDVGGKILGSPTSLPDVLTT